MTKFIREKPPLGKPKTLEHTVRISPKLLKPAFDRSKQTQNKPQTSEGSPNDYAIEKSGELAEKTTTATAQAIETAVQKHSRQAAQQKAFNQTPKPTRQVARQADAVRKETAQTTQSVKAATRVAKKPKQAVKAGEKAAKTAKVMIKTTRSAAKTAQATAKSAGVTARAMQRAAATATRIAQTTIKAAVTAAKVVAKAAAALAKLTIAAGKALIAAIAAGGWVVVVIIVAVAAIAAILMSVFGVFFSNEAGDGLPMTEAIIQINSDYTTELQRRIDELSAGDYDAVIVSYDGDYDGDSEMANNWQDVLGVYATKTVTDEVNGTEVVTLTPEKAEQLKEIFNVMNVAQFTTHVETETTTSIVDGEEVENTTSTLYINVRINSFTYLGGALYYAFSTDQSEMLEELMSEEYDELFAALLGVDIYGGLTGADLTQISNNLPAGTKGASIVQAALSKIGMAYSKMDCSQLSQYAYAQAGVSLPRTSVEQAKYCYNNGYMISESQLQPGDLIFWSKTACTCGRWNEVHHVGVYIGDGKIVDASSANGRVMFRNLWGANGNQWQIIGYARPHV